MESKDKQKLLEQLVFIHSLLTQRNQFFMDEFQIAKDATVTITDLANKVKAELDEEKKAQEATDETSKAE